MFDRLLDVQVVLTEIFTSDSIPRAFRVLFKVTFLDVVFKNA